MSEAPIRIELFSEKGPLQSLEEPLDLSVRITNTSDKTIWMVGVLPGSEGLRYPLYVAELEGPSGPVEVQFPEGLDYVRGLRPEDFVRLDPGESFDPQGKGFIPIQQFAWFKPAEPGCYRLQLRCDTTAEDPRYWLGHTFVRDRQRVETMLNRVPRFDLRSNTLELEFD
jgi:hypothetical protein